MEVTWILFSCNVMLSSLRSLALHIRFAALFVLVAGGGWQNSLFVSAPHFAHLLGHAILKVAWLSMGNAGLAMRSGDD